MPFTLRNLSLSPQDGEHLLHQYVAETIGLRPDDLLDFQITRKGIDARKKANIKVVYTISFSLANEEPLRAQLTNNPALADLAWHPAPLLTTFTPRKCDERIIIAGSGPAGLFTALRLAEYGLTATIIERGQPVEQRAVDVDRFWNHGILNPESNVQFGEGGAGTFSDGKLTSRSKDPLTPWILKRLVDFGGPPEIRYLAKAHIGTDRLRMVVRSIRKHLIDSGFNVRFASCLTGMETRNGRIATITVNDSEEIPCDRLILATGHSARDTYELMERCGVQLTRKAFAMGLRVEHPQELINSIQYGSKAHPALPVADYAVAWNNSSTGRSAYSFCMCPGGVVIAGASEDGGVVTNGMSSQRRNSPCANSALDVNIREDDFGGSGPLAGVEFQRRWERIAYTAGGCGYLAPAQNLLDFLRMPGKKKASASYRPGITESDLDQVLPDYVSQTIREGILDFNRRLRGFITADATLIGIESRTSAPLRILRNQQYESPTLSGLYPAGEGAGYAGGIMSSAIDGVKIADVIAAQLDQC